MKKILLSLILLSFAAFTLLSAQEDQQNPNAKKAAEQYQASLQNHEARMGSTVQNNYTARDPRQEEKDDRIERREERRDFRRDLKLERASRPVISTQRRRHYYQDNYRNTNWDNTYPYDYNY